VKDGGDLLDKLISREIDLGFADEILQYSPFNSKMVDEIVTSAPKVSFLGSSGLRYRCLRSVCLLGREISDLTWQARMVCAGLHGGFAQI
jgi:hypothetical protein